MVNINPRTGRRRKKVIRRTNYWHRAKGLSSRQFSELKRVNRWLRYHVDQRRKFVRVLAVILHSNRQGLLHLDAQSTRLLNALLAYLCLREGNAINDLEAMDANIADMTVAEENDLRFQPPQRWRVIDDFESDDVARQHTRFTKEQLHEIFDAFDIPTDPDGKVRVPYGANADGNHRYYAFDPEEIFLYTLIKIAQGHTHVHMANCVFGGTDGGRRFPYGYKHILNYTTDRYKNLIGIEGMRRWIPMFPDFAERIRRKVITDRVYYKPSTDEYFLAPGVWFGPGDFAIAFMMDGVFYPFSKLLSGPDGDYIGAMRIEGASLAQRMIYGHKGHGVCMLSFQFPNGISVWYGPVSARRNECAVALWSGVDDLLFDLQQDIGQDLYSGFADKIFRANVFRCIKTAHRGPNLTYRQEAENSNLNKCRVSIEWDYGAEKSQFKECIHRDGKKLISDNDTPIRELLFSALLKNIYNVYNGNGNSGDRTFACPPPELHEYLYVVPDPIANPTTFEERLNIVGDPLYN